MEKINPFELYSVFVGHLHPDVTKLELREVFSKVGEVRDLFIMENQSGEFNYGFVRYEKMEDALLAVSDLHKWPMRGVKLVVDLSKDTTSRIIKEKKNTDTTAQKTEKKSTSSDHKKNKLYNSVKHSGFVQDIMYLSRLKESVSSLNFPARQQNLRSDQGKKEKAGQPIDLDKLLKDIAKVRRQKEGRHCDKIPEEGSVQRIEKLLLNSDCMDSEEGKARAREFRQTLTEVMASLNSFLNNAGSGSDVLDLKGVASPDSESGSDIELERTRQKHPSSELSTGSEVENSESKQCSNRRVSVKTVLFDHSDMYEGDSEELIEQVSQKVRVSEDVSDKEVSDDSGNFSSSMNGKKTSSMCAKNVSVDVSDDSKLKEILSDSVFQPFKCDKRNEQSSVATVDSQNRNSYMRSRSLDACQEVLQLANQRKKAARNKSEEMFKRLFYEVIGSETKEEDDAEIEVKTSTNTEPSNKVKNGMTKSVTCPELRGPVGRGRGVLNSLVNPKNHYSELKFLGRGKLLQFVSKESPVKRSGKNPE